MIKYILVAIVCSLMLLYIFGCAYTEGSENILEDLVKSKNELVVEAGKWGFWAGAVYVLEQHTLGEDLDMENATEEFKSLMKTRLGY